VCKKSYKDLSMSISYYKLNNPHLLDKLHSNIENYVIADPSVLVSLIILFANLLHNKHSKIFYNEILLYSDPLYWI